MRNKLVLIVMACMAASPALAAGTWDGVYSDAQAERGHTAYMQNCGRCHGADLSGTFEIPPLVGRFMPYWSGSTLGALFDYISTAMPLGRPGSLSPATNADILAFILKSNNFPAGGKELSADGLRAIRFDAVKTAKSRAKKSAQ